MWVHTYMATQTTPDPDAQRLCRRVVFELTADEVPLLAAAERRHGTKRAGILAALTALAEADTHEARLAEVTRERDEALAAVNQASKERASDGKGRDRLRRERGEALAALTRAEHERDRARAGVELAERRLTQRDESAEANDQALRQKIEELEARLPDGLYCARCERWAPEGEWAWQTDETGSYAHHRPCGDHGPGLLGGASWLARRATGAEKPTP